MSARLQLLLVTIAFAVDQYMACGDGTTESNNPRIHPEDLEFGALDKLIAGVRFARFFFQCKEPNFFSGLPHSMKTNRNTVNMTRINAMEKVLRLYDLHASLSNTDSDRDEDNTTDGKTRRALRAVVHELVNQTCKWVSYSTFQPASCNIASHMHYY